MLILKIRLTRLNHRRPQTRASLRKRQHQLGSPRRVLLQEAVVHDEVEVGAQHSSSTVAAGVRKLEKTPDPVHQQLGYQVELAEVSADDDAGGKCHCSSMHQPSSRRQIVENSRPHSDGSDHDWRSIIKYANLIANK